MGEMAGSFPNEGNNVTPSRRGIPGERAQSGEVAQEVKEVASQVAGQAKDLVAHQVTQRASRSAEDIREVARALRQTREQLSGNVVAPYVDKAADQLDKLSRFLREARPDEVVHGVERFARREPLLFLGGAFALGILGARFLKSSSHHGYMGGGRGQMSRMGREPARETSPTGKEPARETGPRPEGSFVPSGNGGGV